MNRCTCYKADPAYHASALRDAEACSRALTPAPDLRPDDVPLIALDLGPLKDRDLAILYCGVFIASVRGGRIAVGVRSKKAVDAALFTELERRGLTTLDAVRLASGAAMTAN